MSIIEDGSPPCDIEQNLTDLLNILPPKQDNKCVGADIKIKVKPT